MNGSQVFLDALIAVNIGLVGANALIMRRLGTLQARVNINLNGAEMTKEQDDNAELHALRHKDFKRALDDWGRRCDAAFAAIEMPTAPHRIRFIPESRVWVCETAIIAGSHDDHFSHYNYTAEMLDSRQARAGLFWQKIGPLSEKKEPKSFSVYDEAHEWLMAYLKPVGPEVYFNKDGEEVLPSAASNEDTK